MDLSACYMCRNCQKWMVTYAARSWRTLSFPRSLQVATNPNSRTLFTTAYVAQRKKPRDRRKPIFQGELPKSSAAVKVRNRIQSVANLGEGTLDNGSGAAETEKANTALTSVIDDQEERQTMLVTSDELQTRIRVTKQGSPMDTVIAQVTPCPLEPKDGNKEEEAPSVGVTWRQQTMRLGELPSLYMQLSKSRLTSLVVISALGGYGMAPATFDPITFALMAGGTFLTSCSANTINQFFEVPYDSQMARTRNRVLVRGLLSPLHAVVYASVVGVLGVGTLYTMVNPLAAGIAASTWLLYVAAYTPLKRVSIVNTWVGALVGALPPMIGWAACTGGLDYGALLMAGFLYCWQFPHFNALSWNLRSDYSRGGYCMMATTDPALCRRVALRHCFALIGLSTLAPVLELTTWTFAVDSLPLNLWFSYLGFRFYRDADSKSARKLFLFSLLHLPVLMLLLLISKKDLYPEQEKPGIKVIGVLMDDERLAQLEESQTQNQRTVSSNLSRE